MGAELCPAGEVLANTIKGLDRQFDDMKGACKEINKTLLKIRDTSIRLEERFKVLDASAENCETHVGELMDRMSHHEGEHVGSDKAGEDAGKKYGARYGVASAGVVCVLTAMLKYWPF